MSRSHSEDLVTLLRKLLGVELADVLLIIHQKDSSHGSTSFPITWERFVRLCSKLATL
jgi:hypothetical protein